MSELQKLGEKKLGYADRKFSSCAGKIMDPAIDTAHRTQDHSIKFARFVEINVLFGYVRIRRYNISLFYFYTFIIILLYSCYMILNIFFYFLIYTYFFICTGNLKAHSLLQYSTA